MTIAAWILLAFMAPAWLYLVYVLVVEPTIWHYRDKRRRKEYLNRPRLGLDVVKHR